MVKSKWIYLALSLALCACVQDDVEGTYHADDGEFPGVTMTLRAGEIQFWAGDTSLPAITGTYRREGEQVTLTIAEHTETVIFGNGCLYPEDDPAEKVCKK